MHLGHGFDHRLVDRHALFLRYLAQQRLGVDAAFDVIHDVERCADDLGVFTQQACGRYRHVGLAQGVDDLELALDHVGRGQQFSRRLLAQYVTLAGDFQQECRVGLATLELLNLDALVGSRKVVLQVVGEFCLVELVGRQYVNQGRSAHL